MSTSRTLVDIETMSFAVRFNAFETFQTFASDASWSDTFLIFTAARSRTATWKQRLKRNKWFISLVSKQLLKKCLFFPNQAESVLLYSLFSEELVRKDVSCNLFGNRNKKTRSKRFETNVSCRPLPGKQNSPSPKKPSRQKHS